MGGATDVCLARSSSFDLLPSPVAGSAALPASSGDPGFGALLPRSGLALTTTASTHFARSCSSVLSGLSPSLPFSPFPPSASSSSRLVSSAFRPSFPSLFPCFLFSDLFFLPSSPPSPPPPTSPSALSASDAFRFDFLSLTRSLFALLSFALLFSSEARRKGSRSWNRAGERSRAGESCGLGSAEGEHGEPAPLLPDLPRSLLSPLEPGGLAEEELLRFPALSLDEGSEPSVPTELFPFGCPFFLVVGTKPLCFLEVFPSFLASDAG